MKKFNVTAQVYEKFITPKQTLLINEVVEASSKEEAAHKFEYNNVPNLKVVKIFSVEQI